VVREYVAIPVVASDPSLNSAQRKHGDRGKMQRRIAPRSCHFIDKAFGPKGDPTMMRSVRNSLLIASVLVLTWAATSEACHRRRAFVNNACCESGYGYPANAYAGPTGYYGPGPTGTYGMAGGGAYYGGYGGGMPGYGGGYPGTYGGYGYGGNGYGRYDIGRPGYNPGGLGGPRSGLGVRPGLGFGGFGPGR
jgi:hypothetical protein